MPTRIVLVRCRFSPVAVAEDVSEELFVFLREHRAEFPSVAVREVAVRHYPHGTLAAHRSPPGSLDEAVRVAGRVTALETRLVHA